MNQGGIFHKKAFGQKLQIIFMAMKKYIEVCEHDTEKVLRRYDVTQMSEKGADVVENGCNYDLNQNLYFVRRVKCETELETGVIK